MSGTISASRKRDKRFPTKGTCLAIYSRAVNAEQPLEEVLNSYFPWCEMWHAELQALFASYVEIKQQQQVLDYDDLLLYWAHMMQEAAIAGDIAARFDHVLVDEYQDTNKLQASVLLALCPNGKGLTVVGDDAQSIYSFRAATVRNILDFPGHFTPRADIVTLEQNYRSTQPILAAANAVIELAEERFTKNLWSDRKSARAAVSGRRARRGRPGALRGGEVLESREQGLALKAQAVLFRASHHSGPLEVELTRRNIPFVKFGGLKFLEAAHIKDLLSLLRWAENPRDRVAGFRVVQLLPGAGPRPRQSARSRRRTGRRAGGARRDQAARGGRRALAGFRRSGCGSFAGELPAGRPSSTSPAAGTSRIFSAFTTMRCCGRPISCSLCRSPRPIRAASAF